MKTYWILVKCKWIKVTTSYAKYASLPHVTLKTGCKAIGGAIVIGSGAYIIPNLPAFPPVYPDSVPDSIPYYSPIPFGNIPYYSPLPYDFAPYIDNNARVFQTYVPNVPVLIPGNLENTPSIVSTLPVTPIDIPSDTANSINESSNFAVFATGVALLLIHRLWGSYRKKNTLQDVNKVRS